MMAEDRATIIVCDDDGRRVKRWAAAIERVPAVAAKYAVVPWDPARFATAFSELKRRQYAQRRQVLKAEGNGSDALDELDGAALVIIDFDLTPSGDAQLDESTLDTLSGSFGDQVALLVRCYSGAKSTVLVNETFFQSTFDLAKA